MMAASKATKPGRPTLYDPEFHPGQAFKFALLGMTDEEQAEAFRIDYVTFNDWMKRYPEFSQAVTRGKAPADANVAASYYQRALGYDQPTEKIFYDKDTGKIVRAETFTHIPADPGAALNWLKNRQRSKWRDKVEVEHTTQGDAPFCVINMTGKPEAK